MKLSKFQYLCTFLIASAALLLSVCGHARAIETGGIGVRPANPDPTNPRTSSIFVYNLQKNTTTSDAIEIINNTDQTKTVEVYPVDSQSSSDGAFACAQKADKRVDVGNWIHLAKTQITLKAKTTDKIPFTVVVPSTAISGESNGCIAIQELNQSPLSTNGGITLSFRSAIRVSVTIPGEITKKLVLVSFLSTPKDSGHLELSTRLKNEGNVSLDTDIHMGLVSVFKTASKTLNGNYVILPNGTSSINFETKKPFWGGFYKAIAKVGFNADTHAALGQAGKKDTISKTIVIWVRPQTAAIFIEAFLTFLIGTSVFLFRSRYQTIKSWKRDGKNYRILRTTHIEAIARATGSDWKALARLNNIKKPYTVQKGQIIRVKP